MVVVVVVVNRILALTPMEASMGAKISLSAMRAVRVNQL